MSLTSKGQGFDLTSSADGVWFDFFGTGSDIHIAWTSKDSETALLTLDRNGDGVINNAKELFGNITEQPPSADPNGFRALAVFDDPKNGGNGDGIIDSRDAIFAKLRLWQDKNHDGVSSTEELHTLPALGVKAIHLTYKTTRNIDSNGNVFRYAAVVDTTNAEVSKTAYDVFLVPDPGTAISPIP